MTQSDKTSPTSLDRLVAAAPFERLAAMLEAEIGIRARRLEHQHASVELELLRSFATDLQAALADARNTEVIGNVAAAARLAKRPKSTIRRICKEHEDKAGACFVEGEWSIHLPQFLAFIATMPRHQNPRPASARTRAQRPSNDDHPHLGEAA
ncbi:MAG: hypothetical protein KGL53_10625 [Elusimicrobia bacterium]|nr:hypothetical protein [Elusimicrobiota bacterium]